MSKPTKQRGRRSAARVPIEQTTRDIRLGQRFYHERVTEVALVAGFLSGLLSLSTLPLLFVGKVEWGLPLFAGSAAVLVLSIISYLGSMRKINVLDNIEVEEHKQWAAELKEIMDIKWDDDVSRVEALQQLSAS